MTIFYYEGNFDEAFQLAKSWGISAFDLVRAAQARLEQAPADFKAVTDEFLRESHEELFDTREEVLEFAAKHYDELVSGDLGGNLLSKYSMIGRFLSTTAALEFLETVIREVAAERGRAVDVGELEAVMCFLGTVMLHVPFRETMEQPRHWTTRYDVSAWVDEGYARPLAAYQRDKATFVGRVLPDRQKLILTKVDTFGEHPSGLGKFTRTMFARDLRRTLSPVS